MSRIPSYPYSIDEDDSVFVSSGDPLRRGGGGVGVGPLTPRPRGSERSARLSSSNRRDCLPPTRTGQLRPGDESPKVDPLRLVKAENNPLAGQALETITALEKQKQAQKEIRKTPSILDETSEDVDWEQNLSSWKDRRKSSYQPRALELEEEREKASSGGGKRSKTFKELMEDKDKRSNGHGFYTYESENSRGRSRDAASFDSVETPVTKTTTMTSKTVFTSSSSDHHPPPPLPPSISDESSRSSSNAKEREFHFNTSLTGGHHLTGEDRTDRSTLSNNNSASATRSSQEKPDELNRLDAQKQATMTAPEPKVVVQRKTAIESAHSFDTGKEPDKKPWRSTDRQTSELTSSLTISSFGVKLRDRPGGGTAQPRPYSYALGGSGSMLHLKTDVPKPTAAARLQVTSRVTTGSGLLERPSKPLPPPAPLSGLSKERKAKSNWELNFAGKSDRPEIKPQQKLLAGVPSPDKFKQTLSLFQTKEAEAGGQQPATKTTLTMKRPIGRISNFPVETSSTKPVRAAGVETRSVTNVTRNDYLTDSSAARLRGLSRSVQGLDGYRLEAAKPDRWSASYDRYLKREEDDRYDARRREDKKEETSNPPPTGSEKALSSTISLVNVRTSRDGTNVDKITHSVKSADTSRLSGVEAEVRELKSLVEMKKDVDPGERIGVGSTVSWTLKIGQDPSASKSVQAGVSYEKQASHSDAAQKRTSGVVQSHQNILETRHGDASDWRMEDKRKDLLDDMSPRHRTTDSDDESSVKDGGRGQKVVADDRTTTIRAENPPETSYKYGRVESVKPSSSSYLSDLRGTQHSDSYRIEATASSRRPAIDTDMSKSLTTREVSRTTVAESRTSVPEKFSSDPNSSHQRNRLTQQPSISDIFSRRSAAAIRGGRGADDDDDDDDGKTTTLSHIVTSHLDTGRNEFAHRSANDDLTKRQESKLDDGRKFDRESFQDGGKLSTKYDVTGSRDNDETVQNSGRSSYDSSDSNMRRYGMQRNSYVHEAIIDGSKKEEEDIKHAVGSHNIVTAPKHQYDSRRQELEFQVNFSSSRFDQKPDGKKTIESDRDRFVEKTAAKEKGGTDNLFLLEPLELTLDTNRKSSSESPDRFGRKHDEQTQRRHDAMQMGDGSKQKSLRHEDSSFADRQLKSLASDMKSVGPYNTSNGNDSIYLSRASKDILTLDFLEAEEKIRFLPADKQRKEDSSVSRDSVFSLHDKDQQRRPTTEKLPSHRQRSPSPNQSPPSSPVRRRSPSPPSTDPPPLPVAKPPSSPPFGPSSTAPLLLLQTERSRPSVELVRGGDRLIDFDDDDVCDGVSFDRNSNVTSDRTSSTFSRSTNGHPSHDEKVPEIRTKETHIVTEIANGHEVHPPKSAHGIDNISEPVIRKTEASQEIELPKRSPPEAPKTKPNSPAVEKISDDFSFLSSTQLLDTSANRDKCRLTTNGPMSARKRPKSAFVPSLDPTDFFSLSNGDQSDSEFSGGINGAERRGGLGGGDLSSARKTEEATAGSSSSPSSLRPNASLKGARPLSYVVDLNSSATDPKERSSNALIMREDTKKTTISPMTDAPTANLLGFAAASDDDDDDADGKDDDGPPPPPLPNAPPPLPNWNAFPDGSAGLPSSGPPPGPPSGPPPPLIDFDSSGEEDAD